MDIIKPGSALVVLMLMGLGDWRPCLGANEEMQFRPPATRAGRTIAVKLRKPPDPGSAVFLRVTGWGTVEDLPTDTVAASRGLLRVALPKELRQGRYEAELITERGDVLARGGKLKILASEAPTITKIVPHPSYATAGMYSFELIGENFGAQAEDNTVRINDVPIEFAERLTDWRRRRSAADCDRKMPCLITNRSSLQIYGVSVEKLALHRPIRISVQVDNGPVSAERPLVLSWAQRQTPMFIAFTVLGILGALVYLVTRPKATRYQPLGKRYATLAYLFIDPDSNTYSLSQLQLILWTSATVLAYVYLVASQFLVQWKWQLPGVPEGLPTLLGVSVGTTALAAGATEARGSKGAGPAHPGLGDFITTGGVLAPERLQFFLWTILGVCGFVSATLAQDPAALEELPKIPDNFLPLLGVSSLGYLAGKVVRKPGPIIRQLMPQPPYDPASPGLLTEGIRIVGENLSSRAQVWINGVLIPASEVTIPPPQSAAAEFVTELLVRPRKIAQAAERVPSVKVGNLDGQSAEM
jgi:hypothetical protein